MAFADSGGGKKTIGQVIGNTAKNVAKAATTKPKSGMGSKPKTTTTKPKRTTGGNSPSSSGGYRSGNSGGGKSGGGGGGGGGGSSKPPKSSTPAVPSINSYLGTDSEYQNFLSGNKRTLADYLSELGRRRGEAGTQFNTTTASMENDRVRQLQELRDEFASRGLINSGLYAEEQGSFQQKFTEQQSALQQQQAALLADLLSQETNFKREQDLATQAAKQEALQRRAAKFNIGG